MSPFLLQPVVVMAESRNEHQNHSTVRFTASVAVTCREARARLWEYLDGALDTGMTASIRLHLARCERCRTQHDADLAFVRRVYEASQRDAASETLRERIDALLRERGLSS